MLQKSENNGTEENVLVTPTPGLMPLFCVASNKTARRILQLPNNTHCLFRPYVVYGISIRAQLSKRYVKFCYACDKSKNFIIQFLVPNVTVENTPMGINMKYFVTHPRAVFVSKMMVLVNCLIFVNNIGK